MKRIKINKKITIFSLVIIMLLLSSCGKTSDVTNGTTDMQEKSNETETVVSSKGYQDTIIFAPRLYFASMDIQNTVSTSTQSVYSWVFDTLVGINVDTNEIIPSLAESWNQISDTVWEFKLRDDVKFHDGTTFTANDVKFTYERGLEQSVSKSKLDSLDKVEIVDDKTVNIVLTKPDMDILYKSTTPSLAILSENAFANLTEEEANQIGTGPYKYGEWKHNDSLKLMSNDDYWGEKPKTNNIIVRNIPESAARLIALQTGEVDIIEGITSTDLGHVGNDSKLELKQFPSSTVRYIAMNTAVEPFNDPIVREAIAYGIDREEFLSAVYQGNARLISNVMHPDNEFYSEVEGYTYNPEKAKELLAEAGYPNGLTIELITKQSVNDIGIATILQAQLSKIGVTINHKSMESATFNASIVPGSTYQIMISGWSGYTTGPDIALRSMFHTDGYLNYTNVTDPYIDKTLDEALAMQDMEERKALYAELEEYMTNLASIYPIAVEMIDVATKKEVQGFVAPNGPIMNLRDVYIAVE